MSVIFPQNLLHREMEPCQNGFRWWKLELFKLAGPIELAFARLRALEVKKIKKFGPTHTQSIPGVSISNPSNGRNWKALVTAGRKYSSGGPPVWDPWSIQYQQHTTMYVLANKNINFSTYESWSCFLVRSPWWPPPRPGCSSWCCGTRSPQETCTTQLKRF